MRIAQIAPLFESVPPAVYGGTERVVSYLTEELVRAGHEVTLFASGDSRTSAELVPIIDRSLRLNPDCIDHLSHQILQLERVAQAAPDFDILHFHVDYLHFPISRRLNVPNVTTLHGRLDIADLQPIYDEFHEMPVVSISKSQCEPLPQANWVGTVYHGLPPDLFTPRIGPAGDYLAFVGRISPEKRVDRAIEIARLSGLPIRVAAKIDAADEAYFHDEIAPLFTQPFVEYLGELDDEQKGPLMSGARALLFPIDWKEPFGLVMIEAMACGTPTIAWRNGSVPEVVTDGLTGFIVDGLDAAVAATRAAAALDRRRIRTAFEARFSADRMARDYVAVYESLLQGVRPTRALSLQRLA